MRKARVVPVLLLLVLIVGCATVGQPTQPLTPLQIAKMTAIAFLETYKAQYLDAEAMGKMAVAGQLSVEQVKVYRVKRQLLVKVKPLIDIYVDLVEVGTVPGADREQAINNILNELVSKTGGK